MYMHTGKFLTDSFYHCIIEQLKNSKTPKVKNKKALGFKPNFNILSSTFFENLAFPFFGFKKLLLLHGKRAVKI